MRNLIVLVAVIAALVWIGRNYAPRPQSTAPKPGESVSRGVVDQVRQQPDAVMDMGNAMPAAGGGSAKAMLDTARGATH